MEIVPLHSHSKQILQTQLSYIVNNVLVILQIAPLVVLVIIGLSIRLFLISLHHIISPSNASLTISTPFKLS
jgi:hypothetical protein